MSHYSIGEQKYPNPRNAEILVFTPIMLTNFMLPVMSSQCVELALRVGCKKKQKIIRHSKFGIRQNSVFPRIWKMAFGFRIWGAKFGSRFKYSATFADQYNKLYFMFSSVKVYDSNEFISITCIRTDEHSYRYARTHLKTCERAPKNPSGKWG